MNNNIYTSTIGTQSSIFNITSSGSTLTIGGVGQLGHLSLYSSSGSLSWRDDEQEKIDSLKELVNFLLSINGIELDIDQYIKMIKDERIMTIRDIKIKKILPDEPK